MTRPTPGLVKEALFSALFTVEGARFLDLFAGCGAVGIEALSRGAAFACFVEKAAAAAVLIKKNLAKLDFSGVSRVVSSDAAAFAKKNAADFNIVFIDPPYQKGLADGVLNALAPEFRGIAAVQCCKTETLSAERFTVLKEKQYGLTKLILLERR